LARKRPVSSRQIARPSARDAPAQNPNDADRSVLPTVALESTANVRIAGRSTFRMTYQYESVDGVRFQ